jgi:hypothetical protein
MEGVLPYLLAIGSLILLHATDVVGFVMPLAVRTITKDIKNERERYILSIVACLIAALLLHGRDLVIGNPVAFAGYASLIFIESNTMYKLYFRPRWRVGSGEEESLAEITP